jgi:crotonobetainyl-CoA:carnitine CoA-transferase CaiB-like acyl-CoA transferase
VASADVVISNFKPGTLDKLGLGYRQLAAVNPRVIVGDSSAFGGSGPWRGRPGYGPLIRASTGVMELWRYAGDPGEFGDEVSIYPDHATGRAVAAAVLALLIRRELTGSGGRISVSQSELVLNQMAREIALTSADLDPRGAAAGTVPLLPRLYQCAGDDEWCVIDVRDDAELARLRREIAADGFGVEVSLPNSHAVAKTVAAWTATLAPSEVARRLQRLRIPAGMMLRVVDLPEDPHLRHRGFFRTQHQVECGGDMLAENAPARFGHIPEPHVRRAPMLGEHTVEICKQDLGMTHAEIDRMVAAGVLEVYEASGPGSAAPGN